MKICKKCGYKNLDNSMFCENCGTHLNQQTAQNTYGTNQEQIWNQQPQKKNQWVIIVSSVLAVIVLLAVLFFLFGNKLPIGKKENIQQEIAKEQEDNKVQSKEEQSEQKEEAKENQEDDKEETKEEKQKDKEEAKEEERDNKAEQQEKSNSYAGADINGADNTYVEVTGTMEEIDDFLVLKLPKEASICAYDIDDKIVEKKDIKYLILNEEDMDMEDYLGDELAIKGKLSVDSSGKFILTIVKLNVEQEAMAEENKDFKEHRYELILNDVTWEEAFEDCAERGGYLVQINSEEEYQSIIQMIEDENMQNVHFYLGGRRDRDGREYYWVDVQDKFVGEVLNPEGEEWTAAHWMDHEPSFVSEGEQEMYMNLIYFKEQWVLNDVPVDITMYYPGKTGYICEFDE